MSSLGSFVIIPVSLGVAVVLSLVAVFGRFPGLIQTVRHTFFCPFLGRDVKAEFREKAWDGRALEVECCSAFTPATAITCERRCLGLGKLPRARGSAAAA